MRIGPSENTGGATILPVKPLCPMEDSAVVRVRELAKLAGLLADGLVSRAEFVRLKKELIGDSDTPVIASSHDIVKLDNGAGTEP